MMIQFKSILLAMILILIAAIASEGISQAGTGRIVEKIEEPTLDALIRNPDNRIVVTFMAAWCWPCVDELPALNKLYKKYNDQGLKLIGISIDLEGPQAIQPIINEHKIEFPVFWYGDKAITKFKLNAIPMLFFVRKGEIVEKVPGKRTERFLNKKFKEFLK